MTDHRVRSQTQPRVALSGAGRMVAALALLTVVALASTSRLEGGGVPMSSSIAMAVLALAGLVTLALAAIGLVFGGYASFVGAGSREKALVAGIGAIVFAGILTVFLLPRWEPDGVAGRPTRVCIDPGFWWFHYPNRRGEIDLHPERFCPWPGGGGRTISGGGGSGGPSATLVAAVAGGSVVVLLLAAAAVAIALRRSSGGRAPIGDEGHTVEHALTESLDDLRRECDVRRAIVACYARMEHALASVGVARRPQEAPLEYLQRVLEATAASPARVLTELFERAKFSFEPMGERDKEQAIGALEALRDRISRQGQGGEVAT